MFSGEIGRLQPRTSYAVARTIGTREMAQNAPACSRISRSRRVVLHRPTLLICENRALTIGHVIAIGGRLAVAGSFLSSRQPGWLK
jgi:hypothetical protein